MAPMTKKYLETMDQALERAFNLAQPQFLIYLAGADATKTTDSVD